MKFSADTEFAASVSNFIEVLIEESPAELWENPRVCGALEQINEAAQASVEECKEVKKMVLIG